MGVLRLTRISLLMFTVSVCLGAIFAALFLRQNPLRSNVSPFKKFLEAPHEESYAKFLNARNLKQMNEGDDRSTLPVDNAVIMQESTYLLETFPILCWVMLRTDGIPISTWPYLPDLMTAGQAIKDTWARHCTHIVYFSGPKGYEGMPEAVPLKTRDLSSWNAAHEALTHLFENFPLNNFAWVVRVEQDSFLIIENLAYYLSIYNASMPYYLGHVYQQWGRSFNVDGPGITLSRGAMMLLRNAFSKGHCPPQGLRAAAALAQCLAEQGVYPHDTRDRQGRGRFLMYQPELLLVPGNIPWSDGFWMHTKYMSNELWRPDATSEGVPKRITRSEFLPRSPHSHGEMDEFVGPEQQQSWHDFEDEHHHGESTSVAKELENQVRVLCWVMTSPSNYISKAQHVKATWGKRCNKLLFMSSKHDDKLPAVGLNIREGREWLWGKTRAAFQYIYDHHYNDADWFLKADDDTYVVVENLRHMLKPYDPKEPVYFGRRFKPYVPQGYMSGGAGYVLSQSALKKFVTEAMTSPSKCRQDPGGAEDLEMGQCMQNIRVHAGDSRDNLGRETFHPFVPQHHLIPGMIPRDNWYWEYNYYPPKEGPDCCSDYAITFHYVPPNMMYVFEYMIYHLKPYGISTQLAVPLDDSAASKYMADRQPANNKVQYETRESPGKMRAAAKEEDSSPTESRRTPLPKHNIEHTHTKKSNLNERISDSDLHNKLSDSNQKHQLKIEKLDNFDIEIKNKRDNDVIEMKEDIDIHPDISSNKLKI